MPPPIGLPSPFFRCPFATDHPGVVSIAMGIKYSRRIKRSAACSHARRRATTRASNVTPWPRLASLARLLAREDIHLVGARANLIYRVLAITQPCRTVGREEKKERKKKKKKKKKKRKEQEQRRKKKNVLPFFPLVPLASFRASIPGIDINPGTL